MRAIERVELRVDGSNLVIGHWGATEDEPPGWETIAECTSFEAAKAAANLLSGKCGWRCLRCGGRDKYQGGASGGVAHCMDCGTADRSSGLWRCPHCGNSDSYPNSGGTAPRGTPTCSVCDMP